jgi:hypothetical protein
MKTPEIVDRFGQVPDNTVEEHGRGAN